MLLFKESYRRDLDRVLMVRLKPEMDRRIAAAAQTEAIRRVELEREQARRRVEEEREEAKRREERDREERTANTLRDRMYECTEAELEKLVRSSESADVLATAAMNICRREVDAAVDARAELTQRRIGDYSSAALNEIRGRFRSAVRESVVTSAVQVRARAASAGSGSDRVRPSTDSQPAGVGKELRQCLETVGEVQRGRLVDRDRLVQVMIDLCRPEIENAARAAYLSTKDLPLEKARENAVAEALKAASSIVLTGR